MLSLRKTRGPGSVVPGQQDIEELRQQRAAPGLGGQEQRLKPLVSQAWPCLGRRERERGKRGTLPVKGTWMGML